MALLIELFCTPQLHLLKVEEVEEWAKKLDEIGLHSLKVNLLHHSAVGGGLGECQHCRMFARFWAWVEWGRNERGVGLGARCLVPWSLQTLGGAGVLFL